MFAKDICYELEFLLKYDVLTGFLRNLWAGRLRRDGKFCFDFFSDDGMERSR